MRVRYEIEGATVRRYDAEGFWDRRYHLERFARVSALLDGTLRRGDRFLDVGCGTGEYLSWAVRHGVDVAVGVDLASASCSRAGAGTSASPVVADAALLPFPDQAFDVVLCSEVIEHLPRERAGDAIRELTRVTARSLVVTTPNNEALIRRVARRLAPAAVARGDADVGHVNLVAASELHAMFPNDWERDDAHVWHITPPVVGEILHLPASFARVLERSESTAERLAPTTGNVIAVRLQRGR